MKILHLIPSGGWYGSEVVAAAMANWQAADHDVHFAWMSSDAFPAAFARRQLDPRVTLHSIPEEVAFHDQHAPWLRTQLGTPPDVMHSHLNPGAAVARSLDYHNTHWVVSLHIRFYWKQFAGSDGVLAISPWQLRDIPARYAGQGFLVRNCLTSVESADAAALADFRDKLGATDNTFVVGSIGRLHLDKGLEFLAEAFIEADLEDARLVIIGEGGERERLSLYAERCPDIRMLGYVENAKQWMKAFDVYVSTARSEPFGMTILDAMQLELPIIASRALGPQDILGADSERLVDIGDVAGTARALRRAYERRETSVSYDLTPYSTSVAYRALMDAYAEVMRKPCRHAHRKNNPDLQLIRNRLDMLIDPRTAHQLRDPGAVSALEL